MFPFSEGDWIPGPTSFTDVTFEAKILPLDSYQLRTVGVQVVFKFRGTVDGSNPAPVEVGSFPRYLKVLYIPGGAGFLPSTVSKEHVGLCWIQASERHIAIQSGSTGW